ncbi:hypothetical protein FSP39_014612 [Pinctada imbricata]|uniref:Uncharacterized protein n=1 Tax=Pinctada imbricata TaxID=66713 RepID=A0AA88XWZ1_PINIB|nr:hypothetical protein FSP39_014612 [Pinctada imbricata]
MIDHEMVYVRARCVPETRQSSESYKLWVLIEKTGCIHSAECSCVAYGVEKVYENANQSYIENVCELTKGQSDNDMWYYQRKARLTASNFHSAIHYKGDNLDYYIVKTVLGKYRFTSEATRYGKSSEPLAREKYGAKMKQSHASFYFMETGVFV